MEDVSTVCRQLKRLRENSHLNIDDSLIECYKYLFERVIVYLNYDDDKNIDVMTEREKFEDIVKDSLLKNFGWYLVPKYTEYKTDTK